MFEVSPKKKKRTHLNEKYNQKFLHAAFDSFIPSEISAVDIYEYMDERAKHSEIMANRELSLLSQIFISGIRWGIVKSNPCKDVVPFTEYPREHYIEDHEFKAVLNVAPPLIKLVMEFGYLTGLRIGDILSVEKSEITKDGLKIILNKTSRSSQMKILMEWSQKLKECVENLLTIKYGKSGKYLVTNRSGKPYTYNGFSTLWQRFITEKVLEKGILSADRRFTFNDIRAKTGTDLDDIYKSSKMLGHTTEYTTRRHYIRNYIRVQPLM